ncbi:hypothetical protein Mucpa_0145 [Mucilaginibacter paludis DSM 18603]|uniref:Uncharacterized protein n=1 Tax=Mucilaginibacter paludis DSM 18603 TaxID=714943 RepID=H1YES8_9SPHI|nr:hypothetical protein Mucpa_0145 [Mucilaginibacter paludis DSM 18603]
MGAPQKVEGQPWQKTFWLYTKPNKHFKHPVNYLKTLRETLWWKCFDMNSLYTASPANVLHLVCQNVG